jgi:hypothetical protein
MAVQGTGMSECPDNWLYENNDDNSARYILGEPGDRPLVCVGINPSTAEPNALDRTLMNVKRFSEIHGYDGWLMLNVYPQRSTDPNELHIDMDEKLHLSNLDCIAECLSEYDEVDVWAAWGTLIRKRKYLGNALRDIVTGLEGVGVRWVNIGRLSKDGHPHHPLYLSHKSALEIFDIDAYLIAL